MSQAVLDQKCHFLCLRLSLCVSLIPSLTDELVNEKEKYKNIADEMDQAFSELSGF